MGTREELHGILCDILGSSHVYYQPPENLKIEYPCIVYSMNGRYAVHADNGKYHRMKEYGVTYISRTPDDVVVDRLDDLRLSALNNVYTSDNLYHYFYTIYH